MIDEQAGPVVGDAVPARAADASHSSPPVSTGGGIPIAIAEQACHISMSGTVIRIDCDTREEAEEMFDWLVGL